MNTILSQKQQNRPKPGMVAMHAAKFVAKSFALIASSFPTAAPANAGLIKVKPDAKPDTKPQKIAATAALQQLNAVRKIVFDLVQHNKWITLSDLMQGWDQNRTAAADGTRLARHALFAVADALAAGSGVNGMPNIQEQSVERLENISAAHPDHYPLAAICAYLRICQVWNLQGVDANCKINSDYKDAAKSKRDYASNMLADHDTQTLNSPLLAGVRFDSLSLFSKTRELAKRYYKEWALLDPEDQVPHAEYRFMQLPC